MSQANQSPLTIYYDYSCPYVYRAIEWINTLSNETVDLPPISWRFFSLRQVNHRLRDGWKIWEQPEKEATWEEQEAARTTRFFWAAAAAARQGDEAFQRYHLAQVRAIHADKQDLDDWASIRGVAESADLDMNQFNADIQDTGCLARLGEDHQAGVEQKVFGTPTYVIGDAVPAYLKLTHVLASDEARAAWDSFVTVLVDRPYISEIKRPQ